MAEERLQRRLAAILSADVVGYSRLMGLDEADTLSGLNALRRSADPPLAPVGRWPPADQLSDRRPDRSGCFYGGRRSSFTSSGSQVHICDKEIE